MRKTIVTGLILTCLLGTLSACIVERQRIVTLEGQPLTLVGPEIKVGQKAPDFTLVAPARLVEDLVPVTEEVTLSQSRGRVRFLNVVPSLDTPVCDLQTQRFEIEASKYPEVTVYTISMDLPFAQSRYCGQHDITNLQTLSDYRDGSFGTAYGVLLKELNLLSRAIFIIDRDDTVRYVEYVSEISLPPDFDRAIAALQEVAAGR